MNWILSSLCYLHSIKPVLHHPFSYWKTVSLYFVYICLPLCLVWSVLFIPWYRAYRMVCFWVITNWLGIVNCHSVITSQKPVCYPVKILSESGLNFVVFFCPKLIHDILLQFQIIERLTWSKFAKSTVELSVQSDHPLQTIC